MQDFGKCDAQREIFFAAVVRGDTDGWRERLNAGEGISEILGFKKGLERDVKTENASQAYPTVIINADRRLGEKYGVWRAALFDLPKERAPRPNRGHGRGHLGQIDIDSKMQLESA